MDQQLASEMLNGNSDELLDLQHNLPTLEKFIHIIQKLDSMPDISRRFWEESRSLYQATCKNRDVPQLETLLSEFFGPPAKPAGKPLPRKLNKESTIRYLGGIQHEQALFLLRLKTGTFYGALWPWRRDQSKVEIHLGYCSEWMTDEDYLKLENLIKRCLSQNAFSQMDAKIGGQIRGIGLPSFLQMAEMEQSSFSLRITAEGKTGTLQIVQGKLLAAQTDQWTGQEAAYRIISWDDAVIEITPVADNVSDEIQQPLMHVLMQSLKIKDEITGPNTAPSQLLEQSPARIEAADGRAKPQLRLERTPLPPLPSRRKYGCLLIFGVLLATAAIIGAGALLTLKWNQDHLAWQEHINIADRLRAITDLIKNQALLKKILSDHAGSAPAKTNDKPAQTSAPRSEDLDFDQTILKINTMPVDENYEQTAITLYSDFLDKYPDSRYAGRIHKSIAEIKNLLDRYYFDESGRMPHLDLPQRLEIYRAFWQRHRDGHSIDDYNPLINEMGRRYLDFIKAQEAHCTSDQCWDVWLQRYDEVITYFSQTELAQEAEQLKTRLADRRDLTELKKKAAAAGSDYRKAAGLYEDYLTRHPQSSQKKNIEAELTQLKQKSTAQNQWLALRAFALNKEHSLYERVQALDTYLRRNLSDPFAGEAQELMNRLENQLQASEQQRLRREQEQQEQLRLQKEQALSVQRQQQVLRRTALLTDLLAGSNRFQPHGEGMVIDLTTGAMWVLLDSFQELNECIDYPAAKAYVKSLRIGGHTDWRLPAANELAALYKQTPFFPSGEAQWYWTSETSAKGFHTVVTIVTTKPESVFERETRTDDQCGAVRATRP